MDPWNSQLRVILHFLLHFKVTFDKMKGRANDYMKQGWGIGKGIGMGIAIIWKKLWYWNGNGIRKDLEEYPVHTPPTFLKPGLLLWLPVCSFQFFPILQPLYETGWGLSSTRLLVLLTMLISLKHYNHHKLAIVEKFFQFLLVVKCKSPVHCVQF